jgi:hypothetical protein
LYLAELSLVWWSNSQGQSHRRSEKGCESCREKRDEDVGKTMMFANVSLEEFSGLELEEDKRNCFACLGIMCVEDATIATPG